ncbi:hypothetical protein FOA43_002793 [Brettanomyces nanus]|uniref:Uncharacterized protein n=1 Tax=Eeniella nana TaxID=13502 RepID=A0A875S6U7_EENNA|nr:uncharacterized protein FOA43_002793 [Brettanomyces nanus]QPG75439.1 hypothetical protein FOA43_002793 [Brettanomyces nanus]
MVLTAKTSFQIAIRTNTTMSLSRKEVKIISLMTLDTVFFLVEIIIGYLVNSLALIADSFHMLNDILSLSVALWAVNVAKNRVADAKYTYGWQRAEILGALVNGVFLFALCFTIFIEAIQRLISPPIITNPQLILYVGALGLASNIVGLFLFHDTSDHSLSSSHTHSHEQADDLEVGESSTSEYGTMVNGHGINGVFKGTPSPLTSSMGPQPDDSDIENVLPSVVVSELDRSASGEISLSSSSSPNSSPAHLARRRRKKGQKTRSLNMEGVFLHVLGDSLGNVGVMVTAILIWKTDYKFKYYFDPLVSLFITCIIFSTALPLCRSSSRILLQGSPITIDSDEVKNAILHIPEVISVHDFHIWNLTESYLIATMHVDLNCSPEKFLAVASNLKSHLHDYGIHSATIQPEFSDYYAKVNMLPKRYSSSQNLPGLAGTSSASANSATANESTALLESSASVRNAGKNDSSSNIHCMVDASAGCTMSDCVNQS